MPEVLKYVGASFAGVLECLEWIGCSGPTDRAVYAALLITARRYGQPVRGGVKVYLTVRELALAAGFSRPTVPKALDRLRKKRLVYRAPEGRERRPGPWCAGLRKPLPLNHAGGVQIVVNPCA